MKSRHIKEYMEQLKRLETETKKIIIHINDLDKIIFKYN